MQPCTLSPSFLSRKSTTVSLVSGSPDALCLSLGDQSFLPYQTLPELSKTMVIRLIPSTDSIHAAIRSCGYCPLLEVFSAIWCDVADRTSLTEDPIHFQSSSVALGQVLLGSSRRFPVVHRCVEQSGRVGGEQHELVHEETGIERERDSNKHELAVVFSNERSIVLRFRSSLRTLLSID